MRQRRGGRTARRVVRVLKLLRALIIDPDQSAQREISTLLSQRHFDSVHAEHCVGALRFATDRAIDLIVADVDLRDLDAMHFLRFVECGAFGKAPPPIIFCSARFDDASWRWYPVLKGVVRLPKPFTERDFEAALSAAFPAE